MAGVVRPAVETDGARRVDAVFWAVAVVAVGGGRLVLVDVDGGGGVFFEVGAEEERIRSKRASLLFLCLGG